MPKVGKQACLYALGTIAIVLLVWRLDLIGVGPDQDTDAYGHHAIARQLLVEPTDFGVHWVWLPLFHYAQAVLIALGATMDTIRYGNAVLTGLLPLALFYVLKPATNEERWAALFASVVAALSPIAIQMGTTAQPEPLFALLVLLFVAAYREGRYFTSAVCLASACLLRYEAWAVLLVLGAKTAWTIVRRGRLPLRALWAIALPAAGILFWAVLRRPVDGRWFAFLHQTRDFANDALHSKSSLDRGFVRLASDLLYYAAWIPWKTMGPIAFLAPFGLARTWRRQGALFVLAYAGCLGFVTLTWVLKSSLGLDRHFVVLVPFYAALSANGAMTIFETLRGASRPTVAFGVGSMATLLVIVQAGISDVWMHHWRGALAHGFPDRMSVSTYLRSLPTNSLIFCDEATIEILSGVDRRRFDRHWVDDPSSAARMDRATSSGEDVYVASWLTKIRSVQSLGEVVYPTDAAHEGETGFAVLRVRASRDVSHAAQLLTR